MSINEFADALEERLRAMEVSQDILSEAAFERELLVPAAWATAKDCADVRIATHPFLGKNRCMPDCDSAWAGLGERSVGCPRCWRLSKQWSEVRAFGLKHNFDLVARDGLGDTLAVEAKWIGFHGGKAPNGEFQRFIGQCSLAASVHNIVIGVCGLRDWGNERQNSHTNAVEKTLSRIGVRLVVRAV